MEILSSLFGRRHDQLQASQAVESYAPEQILTSIKTFPPGLQETEATGSSSDKASQTSADPKPETGITSRQSKAPVIFAAGLGFTAISFFITRRSFARRRLGSNPLLKTSIPHTARAKPAQVSGAMEAFEALNIATINVLSLATMATGGVLWYLDIANIEEARIKLRSGTGFDGSERSEKEAEEDFEEWLATTLSRKEAKERTLEQRDETEGCRRNERRGES